MFFLNLYRVKKNSIDISLEYKREVLSLSQDIDNVFLGQRDLFGGEIEVGLDRFDGFLPSGFLPLVLKLASEVGFFNLFREHLYLPMKEVDYTLFQKVVVLISSILVNCSHIKDINHKLKPYPELKRLLGIRDIPDQSTINRFLNRFNIKSLLDLELTFDLILQTIFFQEKRKVNLIIDVSGLVVYGDTYQFAKKGYFPKKRGDKGYQVSIGMITERYPKIVSFFLDPGNIPLDMRLWDTIYQAGEVLGGLEYIGLILGDAIYGTGKHIKEIMEMEFGFVIKGRDPRTAINLSKNLGYDDYYWINSTTEVAELGEIPLPNCPYPVRTVILKEINAKGQTIFARLLTSIHRSEMDCVEVFSLYNERVNIESLIKANKNGL
ncbi:MAG: hypothetical protein AB1297_09250, partial [bacterium]